MKRALPTSFRALQIALAAGSLVLVSEGARAGGFPEYIFSTTNGTVTRNGALVPLLGGAPVIDRGVQGGVRVWSVQGNCTIEPTASVRFTGLWPAKLLIGGNLLVPVDAVIQTNAFAQSAAGAGGGSGALQTPPGLLDAPGGDGGEGSGVDGSNGLLGGGSIGGNGGSNGRDGGRGGNGTTTTGASGQSGLGRQAGSNGTAGVEGFNGIAGFSGDGNTAPLGALGVLGSGGTGGIGLALGGGGGAGGAGGASGTNGSAGARGSNGNSGSSGNNGSPGTDSASAPAFVPGSLQILTLNGGNGGASGASGGGGGGGAGGSSGGGGGGGGGSVSTIGGGGGAGGGGGRGGNGGIGGEGGAGGGGGGALQIYALGRIDLLGAAEAKGGAGSPGLAPIIPGAGLFGGSGGLGAAGVVTAQGDGGRGGDGGDGGVGGSGGVGGRGGNGGGGSGGTIFLNASILDGTGTINVAGGAHGGTLAPGGAGRVLFSHTLRFAAPGANFVLPTAPALRTVTRDLAPFDTNPYFPGAAFALLAKESQTGSDLDGGVAPYGVLPTTVSTDANIAGAVGAAPSNAIVAVLRYNTGPVGFSQRAASLAPDQESDMLVVVNLRTIDLSDVAINSVRLQALPFSARTEFGGAGLPLPVTLPAGRAWAVNGPATGPWSLQCAARGISRTLLLGAPLGSGQANVAYLLGACGSSDVAGAGQTIGADGQLTADDIIVFIGWFFASDARADVAGSGQVAIPDGQFTADDIIVFINRFFAGC